MKLLLDECLPRKLARDVVGHEVFTVEKAGLKGFENGALMLHALDAGFDVVISVDKNIEHQQNLAALPLAVLILSAKTNRYKSLLPLIPKVLEKLQEIKKDEIISIE